MLRGTIPDENTIVVAQIDQEGSLQGVDGIVAKTKAIFQNNRFDTLVVANEENLHQAKTSLKRSKNKECVHIVPYIPPRIDQLITIRSWLVNDLLSYLKTMEEELTRNPLLDRFGRNLDDLRIPLQVVPYEPARDVDEIRAHEHFRKTPQSEKGTDENEFIRHIYSYQRRKKMDEMEMEQYIYSYRGTLFDKDKESPCKRERLDELEAKLEMAILLGDPGSGKTEWLKHRICLAIREAKKQLEGFEIKLKDLCFPAYLRLLDVSEALQEESKLKEFLINNGCIKSRSFTSMSKAEKASAAILMSMNVHHKMPERLVQWLWEKIRSQQGTDTPLLICLDAWDEVQKGQEDLADCLKAFAQQQKARIFLTSRILGYSHSHPPLPMDNKNDEPHRVLEFCPFQWEETETFVRQFFHDAPDTGNNLLGELKAKVPITGMIQNPLLATLLCKLFSSPTSVSDPYLHLPVRRCEAYQRVLEGLLGEWREEKNTCRPVNDEFIDDKIILLGEIASHFFPDEAIKRESLHDFLRWDMKNRYMNKLSNIDQIKQMIERNSDTRPIEEFRKDGILIPFGGMSMPDYYMFLHLTFQEYLVASALAIRANNEGWQSIAKLVDKKAWDPVWQEVIVLMAGRLEDPVPLLKLLSQKKEDDYFRHRLALAALCLPEIPSEKQDLQREIMDHITTDHFSFWLKHSKNNMLAVIPHFTMGLPALGQVNAHI